MYVRKKKNRSGTTSVVVFDKSVGYRELHTVGISSDPEEIRRLCQRGREWIDRHTGQQSLDFDKGKDRKSTVLDVLESVSDVLINGTELILNRAFEVIGFDAVKDDVLRALVISRLTFPSSKSATSGYLKAYFDEELSLNHIYRYLDRLHSTEKKRIEAISTEHTRKILGGALGVLFYDVTTLYFETDEEDSLRKPGWSKDGRHSNPQIILGLLVSMGGYPLAYSIHEGNSYEGSTLLPVIKSFAQEHHLEDFIVVADSGLMNSANMAELDRLGYRYILGARIKNMKGSLKEEVLRCPRTEGSAHDVPLEGERRLLVTWSSTRAKKDAHNREKGVKRLEKAFAKGRLNKEQVNKRGYNKFLDISNDITVSINREKIADDAKWDGLKGFITNSDLSASQILDSYGNLWRIERAFRISKSKLEIRPVFHFTRRRIEAHVCICFIALKVYKELERRLEKTGIGMSVDKVLDIAKTITTIRVPISKSETVSKTMILTPMHKRISLLFDRSFWED